MPPPPAALMEELIEEILLRFSPDDPALLVHAALVCKQWCRLVFGAGFRRRFREFHRTPPMLGILYSSGNYSSRCKPEFVRTAASCPPIACLSHGWVLDARHGRVLLLAGPEKNSLVIWDPITDDQKRLPFPEPTSLALVSWSAAVLCAAHGSCDHLDCHSRSFLVVFACTDHTMSGTAICTYSSDTAAWRWSYPIYTHQQPGYVQHFMPRALVGNALYFGFYQGRKMILKYELESHEKSAIDLPHTHRDCDVHVITVDGGLGLATRRKSKLYMWSRKDGLGVDAGWTQTRVIDLEMIFRSNAILVGSVDDIGVILIRTRTATDSKIFTFDLKTYKVKKICEGERFYSIFPYMSFYTPALGAGCRAKGPGGSSHDKLMVIM